MPIRFPCPHCGQSLRAREDKVGRKLKCPKCRQALTVPAESAAGDGSADSAPDDPFSELIVYDDDVVYETEEPPARAMATSVSTGAEGTFDPRRVAVPRWMFYAHAGLLGILALAAFSLGLLIGRTTHTEGPVANPLRPVEIEGNVKWEATTGELGDKDAVVVIVPVGRTPQKKIPAETLLVDKPSPKPDDPALQGILELGGQYARAGAGGTFYVHLMPGSYQVLLVSRNAQQPAGTNPKPEDVAKLGALFTPPEAIVGRQKYHITTMDLNATSKIRHSFGESGK